MALLELQSTAQCLVSNQCQLSILRGLYLDHCYLAPLSATWTVGLSTPLANLPMTPNCVVGLTHWRTWIDLNRLERCNLRKWNKAKWKVLYLCWGHSKKQYRFCGKWIEVYPGKKDRMFVDKKFGMTLQCTLTAQKANFILGCIKRGMSRRSRDMLLLLYSFVVRLTPGVLCPGLEPRTQERLLLVRMSPVESHKLMRSLEYLFCKEKLGQLGLFSQERKRLWRPC